MKANNVFRRRLQRLNAAKHPKREEEETQLELHLEPSLERERCWDKRATTSLVDRFL